MRPRAAMTPLFPEDAALLRRFRQGERDALERVYWAYVDRIEGVVRHGFFLIQKEGLRIEGARADEVADLVQETFARAFSERARLAYDGVREYGPFLITITRNLLVDRARKLGRELSFEQLGEDRDDTEAPEPEATWADEATMKVVREYLATLPDELRRVHEQRYVRSLSQEQAARALGISRQQIRTLEKRLRDGLAQHMERAGIPV
jgi:RNA polymerase sigma-70 factor (ECF subfamily)